jgi:hypothetical protein
LIRPIRQRLSTSGFTKEGIVTDIPHLAGFGSANNSEKSSDLTILFSVAAVIVGLLVALAIAAPSGVDPSEPTTMVAIPL